METIEIRAEGSSPQPPSLPPSPALFGFPPSWAPSQGDTAVAVSLQTLCLQPGFHMTMSQENFSQMIHDIHLKRLQNFQLRRPYLVQLSQTPVV